ncbi:MAG TPA: hypothetical protein VMM57_06985 [Bacteroidota bacterium]|nr:hypothetical protein [Bacteroidota bacterium]
MASQQEYLASLLDRISGETSLTDELRNLVGTVRTRIGSTKNVEAELQRLYRVKNCSRFALGLLWIAKEVERDQSKIEPSADEEALLRRALEAAAAPAEPPAIDSFAPSGPAEQPTEAVDQPAVDASPGQPAESGEAPPSPVSAGSAPEVEEHIKSFSSLLEKFSESIQSGSDDRVSLLQQIVAETAVVAGAENFPQEYRHYCQYLTDFLQYIFGNQFLDDVRVMNIVTNIQSPFAQWAGAAPGDRGGLLDPAVEILRDFKTMFE